MPAGNGSPHDRALKETARKSAESSHLQFKGPVPRGASPLFASSYSHGGYPYYRIACFDQGIVSDRVCGTRRYALCLLLRGVFPLEGGEDALQHCVEVLCWDPHAREQLPQIPVVLMRRLPSAHEFTQLQLKLCDVVA